MVTRQDIQTACDDVHQVVREELKLPPEHL